MAVVQQDRQEQSMALHEMRSELADLRHALNNTQIELQILDEQVKQGAKKDKPGTSISDSKMQMLEKKIAFLEQEQKKIHTDLKQLSTHSHQINTSLTKSHEQLVKLEQTIDEQTKLLSEIIHLKSLDPSPSNLYKVKPGDSLEKIAKMHKVTIEALKRENNLSHNKILIGQELTIPSSETR